MELTKGQQNAVNIAVERYKNGERYTCISGPAGVGKTSTLMSIAKALPGVDMYRDIGFVSYTGKASRVMAQKGLPNVSTIHKLIYRFWKDKYGNSHKSKVDEIPYSVIFIDEISMVDFNLLQDLASFGAHVICCGDSAQLPPVKGRDNLLLSKPHAELTEIVRQEEGSGIIELSRKVREGESIDNFESSEAVVLPRSYMTDEMLQWADVVICAKNKTRNYLNQRIRRLKGFDGDLKNGEQVICLNNYWDIEADTSVNLTNGTIGTVSNVQSFTNIIPNYVRRQVPLETDIIPIYNFDFKSDTNDNFFGLGVDKGIFDNGEKTLTESDEYLLSVNKKFTKHIPKYFDFGYALTCHKFQGSEAPKVLVIEEDFPNRKDEKQKWLYTAITRASERLIVLR